MAKKPKDPANVKANGGSSSGSASSNIFKTLFGDIPEQGTSVSIFSDNNPFRRKPNDRSQTPQQQQQEIGFNSVVDAQIPTNDDSETPSFVEVKKRKRNKENKPNLDEASETPLEIKKLRKDEPEGLNCDLKDKDAGKSSGLGFSLKEVSTKGKGKDPILELESKELSKKGKGKNSKSGIELNESLEEYKGEKPSLAIESSGMSQDTEREVEKEEEEEEKQQQKKKKRKRDELEEKYEAKHYGVAAAKDEGGEGGLGGRVVGEKRKTVDNPEDMLVSKEGFDDEDKLLRTVFVGNLPLKVKKKALLKEFSQFGEVESLRIRSIPILDSKTPRKGAIMKKKINDSIDSVNAYIVFKTEQSAEASLAHNMFVVGGNHIRVDRACPPRKKLKGENVPLYDNKRTVFVGNLPFDVKDEEIYQLFCNINSLESSIEAIRVIRDPATSIGKGIAYVLFKTRGAANLVVKKHNLKLRDRDLRVYHARSTPSKRENTSHMDTNNSPAKKLAVHSRARYSNGNVKMKADHSYQGLRASKSGAQKKVPPKFSAPLKLKSRTQKGEKLKERNKKRPSVAARKANALKSGGALQQAGKKRKLESQTPDSACHNKKARKFR